MTAINWVVLIVILMAFVVLVGVPFANYLKTPDNMAEDAKKAVIFVNTEKMIGPSCALKCDMTTTEGKYSCDANYELTLDDGTVITQTCGHYFATEDDGDELGSTSAKLSLSPDSDFMPCGKMIVTVADPSVTQISDMRVKLTKKGEEDPIQLKSLAGDEFDRTPDGSNKLCDSVCNSRNADNRIEVPFLLPCTDDSDMIKVDTTYEFVIDTGVEYMATLTADRTFTCKNLFYLIDEDNNAVSYPNIGGTSYVVFKKDIVGPTSSSVEAEAFFDEGCFDDSWEYQDDCPPADVIETGDSIGDESKKIYQFDTPHIRDTDAYKKTHLIFDIQINSDHVCYAGKEIEWHCDDYVCYEDPDDGDAKKILTAPKDSDGEGRIYPGCKYELETLCEEGCYPIGSTEIIESIDDEDDCDYPNIWRAECYDSAYEANNNPSRCLVSGVEVLKKLYLCKKHGATQECFNYPYETETDRTKSLSLEEMMSYDELLIESYIENTGNMPMIVSTENVHVKFDGNDPFAELFVKLVDDEDIEVAGNEGFRAIIPPGCTAHLDSKFNMPDVETNPRDYDISVVVDNIDVDLVPVDEDRTKDNKYEIKYRMNHVCCKDCTCSKTDCVTCLGECDVFYEYNKEEGGYGYICRTI